MSNRRGDVGLNTTEGDIRRIITQDDPKLLVEQAREIGMALSNSLTKSQIRNIFGTVRRIQMNWTGADETAASYRQLLMLKPKIQYQAARTKGVKPLADVLDTAIDHVGNDLTRFGRFVDFFEAILAYHTAYGGK